MASRIGPVVVVAALIQRNGRFLVIQRQPGQRWAGYWEFPGGKIEAGEDPRAALRREVQEEVGLTVEVGDVFDYVSYVHEGHHWLVLFFWTRLDPSDQVPTGSWPYQWVPPAEMDDLPILPSNEPIVRRLQQATKTSRGSP
ncbi:MAG: (deoxy)nucleoside triphosphate pyrophosphohydrolase [Acidobacteria bacterium]|nr:(deoxy)nucleoside triphosphate pyrophosphohydrolase [Acidobacteriota bacterium]MDW7983470.1 (deoxy)nucleoside triphosphate pyrophosphohydrolase [Acidobacteriota bacterium]